MHAAFAPQQHTDSWYVPSHMVCTMNSKKPCKLYYNVWLSHAQTPLTRGVASFPGSPLGTGRGESLGMRLQEESVYTVRTKLSF